MALAGAEAGYPVSDLLFAFFDLLLTTAPSNMCGREPTPPPLNTFPHINKPSHYRNAWGPALSVLLKRSSMITSLFKTLHTAVSMHNDS